VASFIPHTTADKTRFPHNACLGISKGMWVRSVGSVDPPDVDDQGNFLGTNPTARSKTRTTSEQERGASVIFIGILTMHQSAAYLARGWVAGSIDQSHQASGTDWPLSTRSRKGVVELY
jgi:hypothetical protein